MRTLIIYGLVDPRQPALFRYVGKSTAPPKRRLSYHIKEAKSAQRKRTHKNCWIRKLLRLRLTPTLTVIETLPAFSSRQHHNFRERHWIAEMRKRGHQLTNLTDGGDGGAAVGVPKTQRHRKAISTSLKGHITTAETRKKLSASLIGRPSSSGTRFKIGRIPWNKEKHGYKVARRNGIGWHHTAGVKLRISATVKQRWIAWRLNHAQPHILPPAN